MVAALGADVAAVVDVGLATRALGCVVATVLVVVVPAFRRAGPRWALAAATAALVYGAALPAAILFHGAVFLFAAVAGRLTAGEAARERRWHVSLAAIAVVSAIFVGLRHAGLDAWSWGVAGIAWQPAALDMWMVLRLVTFLWEFGAARAPTRLGPFTLWMLFPFTTAGPLIRYADFQSQLGAGLVPSYRARAWWLTIASALGRLAIGVMLALLVHRVFGRGDLALAPWARAVVGFNAPALGFYFTMSGYFLLMEALAAPWGVTLPPSFDRPFSRPNIARFWATWNMTVTSVFRDYLFYARWGRRRPPVYVNVMILFVVCGVWHGLNAYWIIWGLMHGAGFCAYLAWRRVDARGADGPVARAAGTVLTYGFVCAAWVIPSRVVAWLR